KTTTIKISIVVAVRNEEKNIASLLESLIKQDYPKHQYEVILVDDHSTDGTIELLKNLSSPPLNLIILQLPVGVTSKKSAISSGINTASGELIVTTDADCTMAA